jgi:hypothetical protein
MCQFALVFTSRLNMPVLGVKKLLKRDSLAT